MMLFNKINWNKYLVVFIIATTLIKLFLMGDGFMAFHDEYRYVQSGIFFQKIKEHHVKEAINALFSTDGRPGDAFVRTIPIIFQYASSKISHLYISEPRNSYPLFIFNYVIYCLILLVHFRFSKLVLGNTKLALLSTLLWGVLANSFLYIRHALAYDPSLLIFYYVLYIIAKNIERDSLKYSSCFWLGMLGFFGYLTYPGYFLLYLLIGLVLFFFKIGSVKWLAKTKYALVYGAGSITMLAITEAISRAGGNSYITSALTLSSTITQGSFDEAYSFLFKYLFEVEGITGILIIALLAFFYCRSVATFNFRKISTENLFVILSVSITTLFLLYASAGYFLHTWVLYGRLLHQFFPFICIICLMSFRQIDVSGWGSKFVYGLLPVLLVISFAINFTNMKSFYFPRDVAWKYVNMGKKIINYCEFDEFWSQINIKETVRVTANKNNDFQSVVMTNGCSYYPVESLEHFKPFVPKPNYQLLESHAYWSLFKGYQYEGYSMPERKMVDFMNFKINVYAIR
jgi:hypothetical protein